MKTKIIYALLAIAAIAAVYYFFFKKDGTKTPTAANTSTDPYEGKNITAGINGVYGGGVIYLIKGGKRSVYGNDNYKVSSGLNWNAYVKANKDDAIVVPQSVIDTYKDLNAN